MLGASRAARIKLFLKYSRKISMFLLQRSGKPDTKEGGIPIGQKGRKEAESRRRSAAKRAALLASPTTITINIPARPAPPRPPSKDQAATTCLDRFIEYYRRNSTEQSGPIDTLGAARRRVLLWEPVVDSRLKPLFPRGAPRAKEPM